MSDVDSSGNSGVAVAETVPSKRRVIGKPWTSKTASEAGKIGGAHPTQKRADAIRLARYKEIISQVGCLPAHQQFLMNFLESGDTARSQVVRMCQDLLRQLQQSDPLGIQTGATQAKLTDIVLKATEHQHGKAPLKIHQINFNLDLQLNDTDKSELIEQLARMR